MYMYVLWRKFIHTQVLEVPKVPSIDSTSKFQFPANIRREVFRLLGSLILRGNESNDTKFFMWLDALCPDL